VIASVDTYLRFAEAVGRLNIEDDGKEGLPELMQDMTSGAAKSKTSGALEGVKEKVGEFFDSDDEDDDRNGRREKERVPARRQQRPRRKRPSGDDDG
jgi:hypothetical protein